MTFYSEEIPLSTLISVAKLQKTTNDIVMPTWLQNPPNYLRAAYVEMVEAIDHHGYKFWKATKPDFPSASMEMVDIFHFVLSHELVRFNGCVTTTAKFFQLQFSTPIDYEKAENMSKEEFLEIADELTVSFASKRPDYEKMIIACVYLGIPQHKLCQWYIGKNCLNNFRQQNDYQGGTYHKAWFGKEDNDYLIKIIEKNDASTTYESIYQDLVNYYAMALKAL